MSCFETPPLAGLLALTHPNVPVYVVGGHALKQWVGGDWEGDVDVIVAAGTCREVGYDHSKKTRVLACDGRLEAVGTTLYRYRYAKEDTPPSECPPDIHPFTRVVKAGGTMAADIKIEPSDVPIHWVNGDQRVYDIFSTEVSDIRLLLTSAFDLNICAIGYRVIPWDVEQGIRTMRAFYTAIRRTGVDMPADVRRYLASWTLESSPRPELCRQWFFGDQFDERAARKEPGTYAILQWQRCSTGKLGGAMTTGTRGRARALKYQRRGYQIAETPPRVATDDFGGVVQDAITYRAEKLYEKEERERKRVRVRELMLTMK